MESHKNVMLGIRFLLVMVKRSREKKKQEETEKQHHVNVTENNLFKRFTTKGVRSNDLK